MQKLEGIISGSVRVTEGEALQKFKDDNIKATFDFVLLDVSTLPDNQIQVTDEDLKAYYEKHKDDYKRENSARLKYVVFSDAASKEDSISTERQLLALTKDLKKLVPGDSTTMQL
jgi:hypothetical protein